MFLEEKEPAPVSAHGFVDAVAVEETMVKNRYYGPLSGYKVTIKINQHGKKLSLLQEGVKEERAVKGKAGLSQLTAEEQNTAMMQHCI